MLYELLIGGAILVLAAQLVRGRSPSDLLGAYSIVGDRSYDVGTVARFFVYHLAELDLYLGVLPFAAFVLLAVIARRSAPALAPFLAAGTALTISLLLVVAAFASEFANRIQERNTFVVAPFFLIALLVWVDRGLPRPRWVAPAVAVACALLPLAIPFERFIETGAISDTLALLPIWSAYGSLLFDSIDATVLAGGVLAAALFLFVPRRWALALPAVDAPLLRRDLAQRLVRRARLSAGVGRGALPGNPGRREGLDRPGGAEGRHGGGRVDRASRTGSRSIRTSSSTAASGRSTSSAARPRAASRRRR